nr:2-succinyl-6-hydroxy-2,4-cyclohexadiene-1-carboxylate synthase [Neobacillus sp. Marseille-Q6967]
MKVKIDKVDYHVEMCGNGNPLVLLHGFTGDSSTWTSFCPVWGSHSQLVMPDIIGHGKTDSPEAIERYRIERAASDIKHLLDKIGLEQIDLLGYSMGGRLALTFAVQFPERVRKLILESASPGLESQEERLERQLKDGELAQFIMEQGIAKFVDYWENIPLFSSLDNLPDTVKEKIRSQRLSNCSKGLANSLLGMGTGSQPSWWQELNRLTCEALLITGGKDKKFCNIAEQMQKRIKNSKWMIINGCGHAIHVEDKEKFGTIISDFLNKGGVSFDS